MLLLRILNWYYNWSIELIIIVYQHVNYGRDPRLSNTPTWKPALSGYFFNSLMFLNNDGIFLIFLYFFYLIVSDKNSETANNSQLTSDGGHFESTVGGHFVPAEESPQLISTSYLPNMPGKPLSPSVKTVTSTPSPNSKPYLRWANSSIWKKSTFNEKWSLWIKFPEDRFDLSIYLGKSSLWNGWSSLWEKFTL